MIRSASVDDVLNAAAEAETALDALREAWVGLGLPEGLAAAAQLGEIGDAIAHIRWLARAWRLDGRAGDATVELYVGSLMWLESTLRLARVHLECAAVLPGVVAVEA